MIITLKDNKIADYKVEALRLSDKIADDKDVLSVLPRCFSDSNCKQEGMIGTCSNPGLLESACLFTKAPKVSLLIITSKLCNVCHNESLERYLKTLFPGLSISYLYYPEGKTEKITNDFGITALPAYLLGKEAQREKGFSALKDRVEARGDFYMIKPQFSGVAYFFKRKMTKGSLDLFISLYDKDAASLLAMIKEFNPAIHFLAIERNGNFEAKGGNLEVEEDLRSVCVQKYYPEKFWDYITCRAKNINTSWWQDCLAGADTDKISACARGEEARALLKENISLGKELQLMFGPLYLINNQEIFASQGVLAKEEFKKIMKR